MHCSQLFFMHDCQYPMFFCYWIFLYALIFVLLFANFYRQTYNKKKAAAVSTSQKASAADSAKSRSSGDKSRSNGSKKQA